MGHESRWWLEILVRHRRHVELSPGAGKDAQDYALATIDDIEAEMLRSAPPSEIASPDALYTALARKVTASQWQNEHYNQGLWDMKEALKGKEK